MSLAEDLRAAQSVKAACAAVVAELAGDGLLMPSIYLMQGGRLRCQAVNGYWQVFDGMPPGVGVIGSTYISESPTVVADTSTSEPYLEAVPAVRTEVCVPVRAGGAVAGVLNVESRYRLPDPQRLLVRLQDLAAHLSRRIDELGGVERESRPARLARHAAALTTLEDSESILTRVLAGAREVSEMASALTALREAPGRYSVLADGPQAQALEALPGEVLEQVFAWVESMTSAYTIGQPANQGFLGHEPLRAAGAEAFVALPLGGGSGRPGILLLTDPSPMAPDTEDIELLELLASHATACLGTARAVTELRDRAARDPLTGLGHHGTFHAALVEACARPPRPRLGLLVADIDRFKDMNDAHGHQAGDRILSAAAHTLRSALRNQDQLFRIGGDEFAVILAVADCDELEQTARRLGEAAASGGPPLSIGAALGEPGEGSDSLFSRADAALYRVKRAGGDGSAVG